MRDLAGDGLQAHLVKRLPFFTLDCRFDCPAGTTLQLLGPSGAGKTTVLRCLAGLERLDGGFIRYAGTSWQEEGRGGTFLAPRHRHIGLLNQDYSLFPHMTLAANLRFAMAGDEDAESRLAAVGIAHLAGKRPHEISGGERQRAALCQTLVSRPRLLLLDEPFSALDVENRHLLRQYLAAEQRATGLTVIQVTHDVSEACNDGDQVLALERGIVSLTWLARQRAALVQLDQARRAANASPTRAPGPSFNL